MSDITPFVFTVQNGRHATKAVGMNAVDWDLMFNKNIGNQITPLEAYKTVAYLRRCVEVRANALSAIPCIIYKGKTVTKWPMAVLLPALLWRIEAALQIEGAGYLAAEKNLVIDKGLRWLLPSSMKPEYDEVNGLTGFERTVNKKKIPMKLEEVIYFWQPNLAAELGPGEGWVSTVLAEAGMLTYANKFASEFFERGAIPAVILSVEGNPPQDQLDKLEAWWKRMLAGVKRAWETVALKASVKPVILGYPTKDLAMPELTALVKNAIAVASGVPQTMLESAAQVSTRVKEDRLAFYTETILPEAGLIEQALNTQYFEPRGLRISLDYQSMDIFQDDEEASAASLKTLVEAMDNLGDEALPLAMEILGYELPRSMTYDELRALIVENKPEPPPQLAATQFGQPGIARPTAPEFRQDNVQPIGTKAGLELATWRRYAEKHGAEKAQGFKTLELDAKTAEMVRQRLSLTGYGYEAKEVFVPIEVKAKRRTKKGVVDPNAAEKDAWETTLTSKTRRLLKEQLGRIMGRYWQETKDAVLDSYADDEFWTGEEDAWFRVLFPDIQEMATAAAMHLMERTGLSVDWVLVAEQAAKFAHAYSYELIKGISDTSRQMVRNAVSRFVTTPGATRENLESALRPMFGEVRASMIAVTETTRAYAEGEDATAKVATVAGLKMNRIWNTCEDELVCPTCAALDGEQTQQECPNHPNCILPGNEVLVPSELVGAAKSFYIGKAIEIVTVGGRVLTVTENHPILTTRGWVAAKLLSERDYVFGASDSQRILSTINPDNHNVPTVIEQVYDSFVKSGAVLTANMPVAAEDFHGDGRFIDGDVDVVNANSFLQGRRNTNSVEPVSQHEFCGDGSTEVSFGNGGAQEAFRLGNLAAFAGNMSIGQHRCALCGRRFLPTNEHATGHITGSNASLENALPESPAIDTGLAREFLFRFASDIAVEKILKIRDFNVATHVYDLQDKMYELYICNGIIVKNCRCWITYEWAV